MYFLTDSLLTTIISFLTFLLIIVMRMIRLTDLLINVKLTDIPYDQLNQTSIYQSMIYVFKCRFIELVQGLPLISQVSVWSIFSS
jgi:hypothetical protein